MSLYPCKICGKMFERVGNGLYCLGPHYRPCPVCDRPVEYRRPSDPVTCCSKECSEKLAAASKGAKQKVCAECRKLFTPIQGTQIYCKGPHTTQCVICGKEIQYTCSPKEKPRTCSRECREALRSKTASERYGVSNVSQLDSVKTKISEKNSSDEVRERRTATNSKRWGVDNPAKNPEIAQKMSESMKSRIYLDRREQTCIERYGSSTPMSNPRVLQKRRATNMSRFGTFGHTNPRSFYEKRLSDSSSIDNYIEFKNNPREYILSHFDHKPTIVELQCDLSATDTPIYDILITNDCEDLLEKNYSSMENEVFSFLRSIIDAEILRNDRTVIKPHKLDIYIPLFNLGIECNPTSTHNSTFIDPWGNQPHNYTYHQEKSLKAAENGIFLFHIFGYEWRNCQDVIKSMLCNLLGKSARQIGARTLHVEEITFAECSEFLDMNHLQGSTNASVRLGLRDMKAGELLAVMTFNKVRNTIGSKRPSTDAWELSRFCNKLNTNVSGGASKLFSYFVKKYDPEEVISFSDVAHTRGTLYQKLHFTSEPISTPSYVWATLDDKTYINRVNTQKRNLQALFHDDTIDIENKTEKEIMSERGFAQVFNSGTIRWTWRKYQ